MTSIHTFELTAYLSRMEQERIKRRLDIPEERQNWTEHRYSDKGIQIILYRGKAKKFIYLKYIVNPKRVFDEMDYLHLLEPTEENIHMVWEAIKQTWNEIACGVPFERLYLSRLDFTCDVQMESEELVQEYIRLLGKSILIPDAKKFSVDGIHCKMDMSEELREELIQNCSKFKITDCEDIQYYNKLYELKNEGLPIPEDTESHILRIELQIHKTKQITKLLQIFQLHNKPSEEQFTFLINNAQDILLNRMLKMYKPGRYYKRDYLRNFISRDCAIKNKKRKAALRLVEDCNRNVNLGRCIQLDVQNGIKNMRKKALRYLSENNISPIAISISLKKYNELPDIFELITKGLNDVQTSDELFSIGIQDGST